VRYGWLRPFSALIVAIDDTLEQREDEEPREPEELLDEARELMLPPKDDTPFGRRYKALMQLDPGVVLAHRGVSRLLTPRSNEPTG
jgi:hypothetical protein